MLVDVKCSLTVHFVCISLIINVEHCSLYVICLWMFLEIFLRFQVLILHCLGVIFLCI